MPKGKGGGGDFTGGRKHDLLLSMLMGVVSNERCKLESIGQSKL